MFQGYRANVLGAAVIRLLSTVNEFSDLTIKRRKSKGKNRLLPGESETYDDNSVKVIIHLLKDRGIIS